MSNDQNIIEKLRIENDQLKKKIIELEQLIELKNREILRVLDSEEKTLQKFKEYIHEYSRLEAKYYNMEKKYELLSNAKLGKLTLKYWEIRKRIPKDF